MPCSFFFTSSLNCYFPGCSSPCRATSVPTVCLQPHKHTSCMFTSATLAEVKRHKFGNWSSRDLYFHKREISYNSVSMRTRVSVCLCVCVCAYVSVRICLCVCRLHNMSYNVLTVFPTTIQANIHSIHID